MQKYIMKPSIELYPGVKVDKDTVLEFKTETVQQTVKDLKLRSVTKVKGDGVDAVYDITVELEEGDILIYEEDGRGYIKPVEPIVTVAEAIEDLMVIKEVAD